MTGDQAKSPLAIAFENEALAVMDVHAALTALAAADAAAWRSRSDRSLLAPYGACLRTYDLRIDQLAASHAQRLMAGGVPGARGPQIE